ncbi:hypothetical protein PoMZ_08666 [Pyricularia oryzae]|uniref:Uncharacterized protein n=1 Tax=Pyricularia oryzae TaxID=318829 RepID=A0A4P7NIC6_PYROR|nr:hypothetical protein PoMZ_08666 [Pyricularia oryzae]
MLQAFKTYFEARFKKKDIAAEIQARVKQVESIKIIFERREKIKPFANVSDVFVEMHDLLGLRIVPRYSAARKKAEAFFNKEFRQLKPSAHILSERKVGEFWDMRFGAFRLYNYRVYNIIIYKLFYKGTQSFNKQAKLFLDILDGLIGLIKTQFQGLMDAFETLIEKSYNADISKLAEAKEIALNRFNKIGPEIKIAIKNAFIGLADFLAANILINADPGQNFIN